MKNMVLAGFIAFFLVAACSNPDGSEQKSKSNGGNTLPARASYNISIRYEADSSLTSSALEEFVYNIKTPEKAEAGSLANLTLDYNRLEISVKSVHIRDKNGSVVGLAWDQEKSQYAFIMPESNVTVDIVFTRKSFEFDITVSHPQDGYVMSIPSGKAQEGTQVILLVEPKNLDYEYVSGSLTVSSSSGPINTLETPLLNGIYNIVFEMPAEEVRARGASFEYYDPEIKYFTIERSGIPAAGGTVYIKGKAAQNEEVTLGISLTAGSSLIADSVTVKKANGSFLPLAPAITENQYSWNFTMPAENVVVSAVWQSVPAYNIVNGGVTPVTGGILSVSPVKKQQTGTPITITLLQTPRQTAAYEYESISIILGSENVTQQAVRNGGEPEWIYTLPADAPAADTDITISANMTLKPSYTITLPELIDGFIDIAGDGVSGSNPDYQAKGGSLVKVYISHINTVDYRYRKNSFTVTPATDNLEYISEGPMHTWTFIMPNEDTAISAVVELTPIHTVYTGVMINGTITINGSAETSVMVKEDSIVTIQTIPQHGYMVGTLTAVPSANAINLHETATVNIWEFTMGAGDITFNLNCKLSGGKPLYSNGVFFNDEFFGGNGSNLITKQAFNHTQHTFNEPWLSWEEFVDESAEVEGSLLNGNTRAIRIHVPSDNTHPENGQIEGARIGFSLRFNTPVNLGDVSALSFWARKHNTESHRNFAVVGFGDTGQNTVYYYGEGNTDNENVIPAEWKRYIVPVPVSRNPFNISVVFNCHLTLEPGQTVYIDEIEFLSPGEVILTDIRLPSVMPGSISHTHTSNAIEMIQLDKDGIGFTYSTAPGIVPNSTATLYTKSQSNLADNDNFTLLNWFPPDEFNFTSSNTSRAAVSGLTVTPLIPNSQFYLALTYRGIASSRNMSVQIMSASVKVIEDFDVDKLSGWLSDFTVKYRYWVTGMHGDPGGGGGGSWITNGNQSDVLPRQGGNLRQLVLAPAESGAMGGRQLPAAVDISDCANVRVYFARLSVSDTYALVLYNGASWTGSDAEPAYTQKAEVPLAAAFAPREWQTIAIPVTAFTADNSEFDLSAVNGWAVKTVNKLTNTSADTNAARIFINGIEAE